MPFSMLSLIITLLLERFTVVHLTTELAGYMTAVGFLTPPPPEIKTIESLARSKEKLKKRKPNDCLVDSAKFSLTMSVLFKINL